jgi:hypothetical protein
MRISTKTLRLLFIDFNIKIDPTILSGSTYGLIF